MSELLKKAPAIFTQHGLFTTLVEWSDNLGASEGVGRTKPSRPLLISHDFTGCSALLLKNTDTGVATLFHFFPDTINKGHVKAMQMIAEDGGHYTGVFIQGNRIRQDPTGLERNIRVYPNQQPVKNSMKRLITQELLPDVEWLANIDVPFPMWSLGYDNAKDRLYIEHMKAYAQEEPEPLKDEPSDYYDFGPVFSANRAQTPPTAIQADNATLTSPAKRGRQQG